MLSATNFARRLKGLLSNWNVTYADDWCVSGSMIWISWGLKSQKKALQETALEIRQVQMCCSMYWYFFLFFHKKKCCGSYLQIRQVFQQKKTTAVFFYCSPKLLFSFTAPENCCFLLLLYKTDVFYYCSWKLLFSFTTPQNCCFLLLLQKTAASFYCSRKLFFFFYCSTKLLFSFTAPQNCCFLLLLHKNIVLLIWSASPTSTHHIYFHGEIKKNICVDALIIRSYVWICSGITIFTWTDRPE